jgi:hypothetical protein
MAVIDEVLQSVCFVGCQKVDGSYLFKGSAFLIGLDQAEEGRVSDTLWVTARHVIDGIRRLGCQDVQLRINTEDGQAAWVSTPISSWFSLPDDPTSDVAVCDAHKFNAYHLFATGPLQYPHRDLADRVEFGVTDEVLVAGLFARRTGNLRNVPIVRMGAIASLDEEEKVQTKLGEMVAYLIECRSIGGLSGSPVFVIPQSGPLSGVLPLARGLKFYLLGLIHGHFDVPEADVDHAASGDGLNVEQVNTGIAIVTPFDRMWKTVEAFKTWRQRKRLSIFSDRDDAAAYGSPALRPGGVD